MNERPYENTQKNNKNWIKYLDFGLYFCFKINFTFILAKRSYLANKFYFADFDY